MAKKRHIPTEKRFGTISADELDRRVSQLAQLSAALEALSSTMRNEELGEITIDGATKWLRGVKLLSDHQGCVEKGIRNARLEQA